MGKRFDVVYDDFSGGHYMGSNEPNQPRNTWTGPNVIVTADEGYLMADAGWSTTTAAYDPSQFAPPSMGMPTAFDTALSDRSNPKAVWYTDGVSGGAISSSPTGGSVLNALPAVAALRSYISVINGRIAFPNGAGVSAAYLVTPAGASTTVTTSANFDRGMWWWAPFAFGVTTNSANPHRLFYSAEGNETSWPALNYYDIGEVASPIVTVIPTNDALYIGKTEGWWVLTGVPGRTATLRRLTRIGVGFPANITTPAATACEFRSGIAFRSERGPFLNVLRGTQVDQFAAFPAGSEVQMVVPSATDVLVLAPGATPADQANLYVWSDSQRRWRRKTLPLPSTIDSGIQAYWWPVTDLDARSDFLRVISNSTRGAGLNHLIYDWQSPREPTEPTSTATGFDSATVTLADTARPSPFRVHKLTVEIDFGRPATQTFPRALTAWVNTDSHPNLDQTFTTDDDGNASPIASSARPKVITTATATVRGHRQTIEFGTNDGATSTFSAAPVLAMTGVKVRRVIMHCEEV